MSAADWQRHYRLLAPIAASRAAWAETQHTQPGESLRATSMLEGGPAADLSQASPPQVEADAPLIRSDEARRVPTWSQSRTQGSCPPPQVVQSACAVSATRSADTDQIKHMPPHGETQHRERERHTRGSTAPHLCHLCSFVVDTTRFKTMPSMKAGACTHQASSHPRHPHPCK